MSDKPTRADKIRINIIGVLVELVIPFGAFYLYADYVGSDFAFTEELGVLIGAGIIIITFTLSKLIYEYLFPKYKDDVAGLI